VLDAMTLGFFLAVQPDVEIEMRIVAIADTHGLHRQLVVPAGDVLVHAGDVTRHGELDELHDFNAWLGEQPHPYKLIIGGNHDWCLQREVEAARALLTDAIYLCDSSVVIDSHIFHGSPWTLGPGWAFGRTPTALAYHWDELPDGIDVLITHGPPLGARDQNLKGEHLGDAALAEAVLRLCPRLHIFGHIHEAYGRISHGGTHFVNASSSTVRYEPMNPPIVVEL
jgi:predicted phosphodiesterase